MFLITSVRNVLISLTLSATATRGEKCQKNLISQLLSAAIIRVVMSTIEKSKKKPKPLPFVSDIKTKGRNFSIFVRSLA